MSIGYIKLHRKMIDSWVFADDKAFKLWIWLLLKANHKPKFVSVKTGRGSCTVEVLRGQLITGRNSIEKETGINGRTAYDILKRFQKYKMTNTQNKVHYSLITIENYDKYQDFNGDDIDSANTQTTNQPTPNHQPTNTNNNDNKEKNDNNTPVAKATRKKKVVDVEFEEKFAKLCTYYPLRKDSTLQPSDKLHIRQMFKTLNSKPSLITDWLGEYERRGGRAHSNLEKMKNPLTFLYFQFCTYRDSIDTGLYVNAYRFNHEQMYLNFFTPKNND